MNENDDISVSNIKLPIDMTDILSFQELVEDISNVTKIKGPYFMQQMLKAKDLAANYLSRVTYEYEKAKDQSRRKSSLAYLEKASDYLLKRGRKITEEACKRYAEIDEEYLKARDNEIYYKVLTEYMKMKLDYFSNAHDDAKKIYGESEDGYGSIAIGGRTQREDEDER